LDSKTSKGKMFLRMLMVLTKYERGLTVSRVCDGLERAKAQGKNKGRRKSGYFLRWASVS